MSERALELLVPIIGDRINLMAALKKLETCESNAACVPTTNARCEVEVVQHVPRTPVVSATRYNVLVKHKTSDTSNKVFIIKLEQL